MQIFNSTFCRIAEMMKAIGHNPMIHEVSLDNYEQVLDSFDTTESFIVFNLCDGVEEEDGKPLKCNVF